MAYADFNYYSTTYLGNKISSDEFNRLALRASAYLDYITNGQLKDITITDDIKNAMCAVAEEMNDYETGTKGIASESVGRVSRTYSNSKQTSEQAFYDIALMYLAGTGLLTYGVRVGHDYKL